MAAASGLEVDVLLAASAADALLLSNEALSPNSSNIAHANRE